jgi:hypothetical protein
LRRDQPSGITPHRPWERDRRDGSTPPFTRDGGPAGASEAHFIRTFRATFGETPHRYLQRRRVERAMCLLRETDRSVTEICLDVGSTSLGTFSRTFRAIVGEPPTAYRTHADVKAAPACITMVWTRPSSFGEADAPPGD